MRPRLKCWRILALSVWGSSLLARAWAADGAPVTLLERTPIAAGTFVSSSLRADCGPQDAQSRSLGDQLLRQGFTVNRSASEPAPPAGDFLHLEFIGLRTSGTFATGRTAAVGLTGELRRDGLIVGSFVAIREVRSGGFLHADDPCSLLYDGIDRVAADIARWMKQPIVGAKLGNAR